MNEIFGRKVEVFHYYCSGMNLKYEIQLQLNSLALDKNSEQIILVRMRNIYIPKFL